MGDVFDAMNRARKDRGQDDTKDPKANGPIPEGDQAGQEPGSSATGDGESPGLPLDQVKIEPDLPSGNDGRDPATLDTDALQPANAPVGQVEMDLPTPALPSHSSHDTLNGYSTKVVVHHDRGSVVTEQYRAIRTQILARARNRRLQVHVLTSSVPEEGKSVSTVNLGVTFSELRNKNILLIEGDLRRPSFDKLFDRECTPGLLQLLRGDVADIDQAIHHTVYDNLQFLPAGGRDPTHCTELLSSPRMAQILERLRDHYDHIFIDTPPVVSVTDAAILAAMGDQTLLVVRLHKTPIDVVERAKRLLRANNCNVSGIILTHMQMPFLPSYLSRYSYGSAYA
jgi:protein-tyrosine kinase